MLSPCSAQADFLTRMYVSVRGAQQHGSGLWHSVPLSTWRRAEASGPHDVFCGHALDNMGLPFWAPLQAIKKQRFISKMVKKAISFLLEILFQGDPGGTQGGRHVAFFTQLMACHSEL